MSIVFNINWLQKNCRFQVEDEEPPEYFLLPKSRKSPTLICFSTLARWKDATPSAKLSTFMDPLFVPLNLPSFLLNHHNRLCKLMTQYTLANLFLLRSFPWTVIFKSFKHKFLYPLFDVWHLAYLDILNCRNNHRIAQDIKHFCFAAWLKWEQIHN